MHYKHSAGWTKLSLGTRNLSLDLRTPPYQGALADDEDSVQLRQGDSEVTRRSKIGLVDHDAHVPSPVFLLGGF